MANKEVISAIGDCANLNPNACLMVSILLPCKFDLTNLETPCSGMTSTTGDDNGLCLGLTSVNSVVCSL